MASILGLLSSEQKEVSPSVASSAGRVSGHGWASYIALITWSQVSRKHAYFPLSHALVNSNTLFFPVSEAMYIYIYIYCYLIFTW